MAIPKNKISTVMKKLKHLVLLGLLLISTNFYSQDKIPHWLHGNWDGIVEQPKGTSKSYDIKVICKAGDTMCVVEYPKLNCSGEWKIEKISSNKIVFTEFIKEGYENCLDGIKIVIQNKKGNILYKAYDKKGLGPDCIAILVDL